MTKCCVTVNLLISKLPPLASTRALIVPCPEGLCFFFSYPDPLGGGSEPQVFYSSPNNILVWKNPAKILGMSFWDTWLIILFLGVGRGGGGMLSPMGGSSAHHHLTEAYVPSLS